MIGQYLLDFKEYQHASDLTIARIDSDISHRIRRIDYETVSKEKEK